MIAEATKSRSVLCKSYFDIISKLSTLEVLDDKEEALSLAKSEANKSSNSILERTEQRFDFVMIRLAEVNHIININYLVSGTEAPPVGAKVSTASTEVSGSTPAPVPVLLLSLLVVNILL